MTLTTLQLSDPFGCVTYRTAGQGAPLVLLHGVGLQSAAWGPQINALSSGARVIALDMPGHGRSDPLPDEPALPDYVSWLHAVLKALDPGPVDLAGHSMGALIAAGYAATYPSQVRRVALLNGVFRRDDAARAAVQRRAEVIRAGDVDTQAPLDRWFTDADKDKASRDLVAGWLSSVDPKGYGDAYAAFAGGDATYADRFPSITCPLLALTGSEDPNSTPAMSRAMAGAAPRGHAVVIDDARHMVNLTHPDRVNLALNTWLTTSEDERETA
ncbi:alpha/beta hydrolase [Shimia sp. SDUM112013]|uniref:alpha/beta fold hydrolase n=1 Tax=Shimia sp. SDUM112013 TaxID=3136160 RepID=UPI0032EDEC99